MVFSSLTFLSTTFRQNPESSSFLLTSFPRKRESKLIFFSSRLPLGVQSFVSPCGRAGYFLAVPKK